MMATLAAVLVVQGYVDRSWDELSAPTRRAPADDRPSRPALADDAALIDFSGSEPSAVRIQERTIALTFDDGPDPTWTPQILDVLRRHDAHATFFVLGSKVAAHPLLVRRIVAEGHELGSHTYTHSNLADLPRWRRTVELSLAQKAIAGATGRHTRLIRMPYSSVPSALTTDDYGVARQLGREGYLVVFANRDTRDWSGRTPEQIVAAAMPRPDEGAVVLLHDSGGDRRATVQALDRLLTTLAAKGYRFTTVSEAGQLPSQAVVPVSPAEQLSGAVLIATQLLGRATATALTVALSIAGLLTVARVLILMVFAGIHSRRARGTRLRWRRRLARAARMAHQAGMSLSYPGVSIVVPAYNEAAGIAATVRSLVDTTYPGPIEVVVVDDGSTDGTSQIVANLRLPGVTVIRQPNSGKPAALNTGISRTRYDIVVLVDGDTVFEPRTLERLVRAFSDPRVGAVSGNTKIGNRRGLLGRWQHLEYVIGFNLDRRMFDVCGCMPTVPGAIGAFRRQALASVGWVSDDTLAEDTDLTMAICRAGWRVVYEEQARAWTEAPSSLRQLWRQRYRWCYGTLQAMWKHRHAIVERGGAGKLGRRGLTYLAVFQIGLPLLAPAVDLFAVYGVVFGEPVRVLAVWFAFLLAQLVAGAYALRLDRERLGALWTLPLQQLVYRQLTYLVVIQSVVTALVGVPLRWHTMRREGTFASRTPPLVFR